MNTIVIWYFVLQLEDINRLLYRARYLKLMTTSRTIWFNNLSLSLDRKGVPLLYPLPEAFFMKYMITKRYNYFRFFFKLLTTYVASANHIHTVNRDGNSFLSRIHFSSTNNNTLGLIQHLHWHNLIRRPRCFEWIKYLFS